jgi:hypothetical protein
MEWSISDGGTGLNLQVYADISFQHEIPMSDDDMRAIIGLLKTRGVLSEQLNAIKYDSPKRWSISGDSEESTVPTTAAKHNHQVDDPENHHSVFGNR